MTSRIRQSRRESYYMSGILAVDQATTTGFAFLDKPGEEPVWGHHRMGRPETWEGKVFHNFRTFLYGLLNDLGTPDCLVFEAPFVPRPNRSAEAKPINAFTLRKAYGWVAHLTEIAEEYQIEQIEEAQSVEFTKFFTGRGRFLGETTAAKSAAKKYAVVEACKARGWNATHDEADALAMLMFTEYRLYPEASLRRRIVLRQPMGPLLNA